MLSRPIHDFTLRAKSNRAAKACHPGEYVPQRKE